MSKVHVVTSVNGEPREMLCEPQQSLLEVLRDELGNDGHEGRMCDRRLRRMLRDD